jgi:predicted kinase
MKLPAKLILVRGLPGGGKTTFAQSTGLLHVEADMLRQQPDGSYFYSRSTNGRVHIMCLTLVNATLLGGYSVVVSNTFIQNKWIEPYVKLAEELDVELEIVERNLGHTSVHNISQKEVERMKRKWEPLLPEWRKYESNRD